MAAISLGVGFRRFIWVGPTLTLANATWKNNVDAVYRENTAATAVASFKPQLGTNLVTQVVQGEPYFMKVKTAFTLDSTLISLTVPTVAAPNQLPTVSLVTSASTAQPGGSVTLTATAADPDGTIARVEYYNGSVEIGESTAGPTFAFTYSNLAVGSYALTARAFDNAGAFTNSAAQSLSVTAAANALPSISLSLSSTAISPGGNVTLTATATDSDGTIALVEYFNNGAKIGESAVGPNYTFVYSSLPAGSYAISAKATDNAGGTTTSLAQSITVSTAGAPTPTSNDIPAQALIEGDSISAGFGGVTKWTDLIQPLITPGYFTLYENIAGSGETVQQMVNQIGFQVQNKRDTVTYKRGVAVLYGGTNDLFKSTQPGEDSFGRTADQIYADIVSWHQQVSALGWRTILVTPQPRNDSNDNGGTPSADAQAQETKRQAIVQKMRATGLTDTGALQFVDFAIDSEVGTFSAPLNTTLFTDGLHMSQAGQQKLAEKFAPYFVNALAGVQGSDSGSSNSTPEAPTVNFNSTTRQLTFSHALGDTQLEVSYLNGAYAPYSIIQVDGSSYNEGTWKGRTKAATGRNPSFAVSSPAIAAVSASGPVNGQVYTARFVENTSDVTSNAQGDLLAAGTAELIYTSGARSDFALGRTPGATDYVEWTYTQENFYVAGLNDLSVDQGYTELDYAFFHQDGNNLSVFKPSGGSRFPTPGDKARIEVAWGAPGAGTDSVTFKLNDTTINSFVGLSAPDKLYFDCSLAAPTGAPVAIRAIRMFSQNYVA